MKVTFASMALPQPSQASVTFCPTLIAPSFVSGTKKRTFTLAGGSSDTTGAPAGTHSPRVKSVSDTVPDTVAATVFWRSFHSAWASASRAAAASASAARSSSGRAPLHRPAALGLELHQRSREGRGDAHVLALDVALQRRGLLVAAAGQRRHHCHPQECLHRLAFFVFFGGLSLIAASASSMRASI